MTAGMPGSGIGGILYICLGFLMPVHELFCTVQGRSSWRRWRVVAAQCMLCAGILGSLWAEAWALKKGLILLQGTGSGRTLSLGTAAMVPALAAAPFIVLALLLAAIFCAQLTLRVQAFFSARSQTPIPGLK